MSVYLKTITLESVKATDSHFVAPSDRVRIYSREHHAWWSHEGRGYATNVEDAGVFTFGRAWVLTFSCDPSKEIEYEFLSEEPALRPIRPLLGDKAPRWTDETQTKCGCDQCQHWSPLIDHIASELSPERRVLLDELVGEWMHQSDELCAANAKLAGDWPGWEAMKDFKPNQETA